VRWSRERHAAAAAAAAASSGAPLRLPAAHPQSHASSPFPSLAPSCRRSAYYYVHKETSETAWELDAAELARVRAEAAAAGAPMRDGSAAPAATPAAYMAVWSEEHRCARVRAPPLPCRCRVPPSLAPRRLLTDPHPFAAFCPPSLPPRSAYYFIHKQTEETAWELDAAEMARVRAEAKAAGLSPLP
jgi:hypothetical protein